MVVAGPGVACPKSRGQDHAWPARDDFHAAGAVARLQETQRKRIDPVHVTVVGEA